MKSLLLFALILAGGPVFAGSIKKCREAHDKMPKACDAKAKEAVNQSNSMSGGVGTSCRPSEKTGEFDLLGCSTKNGKVNDLTKGLLSNAVKDCDGFKNECDSACSNLLPNEKEKQSEADGLKRSCQNKIAATQKSLTDGANANAGATDGSGKTADSSTGNGQMPAMAPPNQQSNNDDEKSDATQPQSVPQQTSATPQQQQQEEKKDGKSGFDDDKKAQSADTACSGGKFMCPGCPGFLQKCPSGDANACISKMSSSDQNIMSSNCGVSAGDSTAHALTNPTTPQSMTGMSLGGGGSGGTSGAVSGGMNTQSMLDDGKQNDTESHGGRKEGGSLGTESAGGGSGGSNSFGSSGSDLFGDTGSAANSLNLNKAVSRSLASTFQNSTDSRVVDRFGPNLFSILGETIKGRCDRNLLLHCPNRK
jgi:hypothetical protein